MTSQTEKDKPRPYGEGCMVNYPKKYAHAAHYTAQRAELRDLEHMRFKVEVGLANEYERQLVEQAAARVVRYKP